MKAKSKNTTVKSTSSKNGANSSAQGQRATNNISARKNTWSISKSTSGTLTGEQSSSSCILKEDFMLAHLKKWLNCLT